MLPHLQENILLSKHTTFKIGGPAKYFYIAKTTEDIIQAIQASKELGIPYYVLGNGSNVLVSDKGFQGMVIKIQNSKFKIQNSTIIAGAGVILGVLVNIATKAGLSGLEWLAGIPGTVGGAIRGNAGAYGQSMSDVVESVKVYEEGVIKTMSMDDCQFGYRDSVFKRVKMIILEVTLKLKKEDPQKIQEKVKNYALKRAQKHPGFPSPGCAFKNIIIKNLDKNILENLNSKLPLDIIKKGKIPVWWFIRECGLAGKKIGGAMVSEKHSNFIVNVGNARADDVIMLISLIKQQVRDKFGIQLEEEIEYLGGREMSS